MFLTEQPKFQISLKKKGIKVVAGGIHITADPKNCCKLFDAICVGRAETTWTDLLEDLRNNSLKPEYIDTYNDKNIESPNYNIEKKGKYIYTNIVSTSRGCPHKCDFCYNSIKQSVPYINRPIEDVFRDISAIGRKHVLFIDDNFCGNPKWTEEFLNKLIPLKIKWSAAVCANIVNYPSLLDLMVKSGCQSLFIGFESINAESLSMVNKKQNNINTYELLINELHKRGIMINASIVFGLPKDNNNTFSATLNWLVKNKIETTTAHILTPYPGTELYKRMLENNQIIDFDYSHYNTSHVVFKHENMSSKELYDGYINFYKEFYSMKNIFKRAPDNKKQIIPYFCFNLFYRKFGKPTEFISFLIPLNTLGKLASQVSYKLRIPPFNN